MAVQPSLWHPPQTGKKATAATAAAVVAAEDSWEADLLAGLADGEGECIIGALSFVKAGMQIPNRKMVVGNPATLIKDVTDEMIDWKTKGTALYQQLPKECYDTLKAVEPLRVIPENRPTQEAFYKTLEEFKLKENRK